MRADVEGFESTSPFSEASEILDQTAQQLSNIESQRLSDSSSAVSQMSAAFQTIAESLPSTPEQAAEGLDDLVGLFRPIASTWDRNIAVPFMETTGAAENASLVARTIGDERHYDAFEEVISGVTSRDQQAIVETAESVLTITDPLVRRGLGLDEPSVVRGLKRLVEDPEVSIDMVTELTKEDWRTGAEQEFVSQIRALGESLIEGGFAITAVVVSFVYQCFNACPAECNKGNCQPSGDIYIIPAGHDPQTWRAIDMGSDMLGSQSPAISIILEGFEAFVRATSPMNVYVICEYDHCAETACWPWEFLELQWVSGYTGYVHVVNTDIEGPEWPDPEQWAPTDEARFGRAVRDASVDCVGCTNVVEVI